MKARLSCAYLRVYQPVTALTNIEQAIVEHARSHPDEANRMSRAPALDLLPPEECREVYEKVVDGAMYVCPSHNRLRTLLSLVAFERSIPDAVVPSFFSEREVSRARVELETIQRTQPDIRPCVVQSVWHVPVRWFVCFDDAERRVEQAGDHPSIRYETRIGLARERVARALDTLTGGIVHPVIVGMIYELKEWLSTFNELSLLELDYASVATLFEPDEIADDHSAADVWSSIVALGEGNGMNASLYYRRVNERWAHPRRHESLN
jgi:hypothetical protein